MSSTSQKTFDVNALLKNAMTQQSSTMSEATSSTYTVLKGSTISDIKDSYLLQFDGLSEPNPGASSGGAVLYSPTGAVIFEAGEFIPYATNNQAEYSGLIIGLKHAMAYKPAALRIEGDSQLIINQVIGKWKIKNDVLKTLHGAVHELLADPAFVNVSIRHVYRDQNKHADKLTNDVMKTRESFTKYAA
jgi:ribonuclease HI